MTKIFPNYPALPIFFFGMCSNVLSITHQLERKSFHPQIFYFLFEIRIVICLVISAGCISFPLIIDEYRHNVPCSGAGYFKQNQLNHTEMATPKCAHISDK